MADFARLGVALQRVAGWPDGSFLAAYCGSSLEAAETALADSPIVEPLIRLVEAGEFVATSAGLLAKLDEVDGESTAERARLPRWPQSPRALSGQLMRLAPDLFRVRGIVAERLPRTGHQRPWRIARELGALTVTSVICDSPSSEAGKRALSSDLHGDGLVGLSGSPVADPPGESGDVADGRTMVRNAASVTDWPVTPNLREEGPTHPQAADDGRDGPVPGLRAAPHPDCRGPLEAPNDSQLSACKVGELQPSDLDLGADPDGELG